MKKADIVNIIKDAEEKADRLKKLALEQNEKNIAKARTVAHQRIAQGTVAGHAKYDEMIQKAIDELNQEKALKLSNDQKVLEDIKAKARSNVEEGSRYIISEFERAINV